jgi:hypothetical protein
MIMFGLHGRLAPMIGSYPSFQLVRDTSAEILDVLPRLLAEQNRRRPLPPGGLLLLIRVILLGQELGLVQVGIQLAEVFLILSKTQALLAASRYQQ